MKHTILNSLSIAFIGLTLILSLSEINKAQDEIDYIQTELISMQDEMHLMQDNLQNISNTVNPI